MPSLAGGEAIPESEEVGVFGRIYRQFKGKAKEAIHKLFSLKSGEAKGVFHRKEIGDIGLIWGDNKKGLQHIINKHIVKHSDFNSVAELLSTLEDVITNGDINNIDANGNIRIDKDGKRVVIAKNNEGDFVLTAYDNSRTISNKKRSEADATLFDQRINEEMNGALVSSDLASEGKDSENISYEQIEGSAISRIPVDSGGNPMYESVDSDTAWDAIIEQTEGDEAMARSVVDSMVSDKEAALKKLQKSKSKGGATIAEKIASEKERQAAIAGAEAELEKWRAIAGVSQRRAEEAEAERRRIVAEAEALRKAEEERMRAEQEEAERRERIKEATRGFKRNYEKMGEVSSLYELILRLISSGDLKFKWGDNSTGTKGLGHHLGFNSESERRKRIWMLNNTTGYSPEQAAEWIEERFRDTGLLTGYDTKDVLDEILDVIRSNSTAKDMYDKVVDIQIGVQERYDELSAHSFEIWLMENLGISLEEYEAYEESVRAEIEKKHLSEKEYDEYNNLIAEETLEREENESRDEENQRDEQVGIDEIRTRSDGILPSESFVSGGGNSPIESGGRVEVDDHRDSEDGAVSESPSTGGGRSENKRHLAERQGDLGTSVETSDKEFDEDGLPFVISSTGTTVFGEIKEETGLTPAPIKLSLGNSKYGLVHLEKRHGKQIRNAGFNSVEEFVEYVCKNYKRIRQGENNVGEENGTYLLQIEDNHNNTLYVELSTDGSYWGVNSGGVFRKEYGNNKKEVWSASEVQNEQSATDSTLRDEDKSDNPTTPNGNVPSTSDSKDTTISPTTNELGEKSAVPAQQLATESVLTALRNGGIEVIEASDAMVEVTPQMRDDVMQGQPMFFRTPRGVVYGWTIGGKIYLTPHGMNPNTPIHEYTHLWANAMMQRNPKGWESVKTLLRGTPKWNEVMTDSNYSEIQGNEDLVASEVLSRLSGKENAAKLEAESERMIVEADGALAKSEAVSLIERMKRALQEFWNWVGTNLFEIAGFDSIEQVTDRVLWDLLNGTDLQSDVNKSDDEVLYRSEEEEKSPEIWLPEDESSFKGTAISSDDGTKILKNIDNVIYKYENSNRIETFVGDVANALGVDKKNKSSKYATFETMNGKIVTIRISDHNATVSNFDNNGEENGISIVVSRKPNEGVTNDGNAHVVEFFYSDKKLKTADGKPLAEILKSIKQALYSGEYRDTTGLAEREEVNDDLLYRIYGGNSGYVGYSKSKRAVETEERGLRNKSQMNSEFAEAVNRYILEQTGRASRLTLKEIKAALSEIRADEWHHTSKYGNRTNYYSVENVAKYFAPEIKDDVNSPTEVEQLESELRRLWDEMSNHVRGAIPTETIPTEFGEREAFKTSEGYYLEVIPNQLIDSKPRMYAYGPTSENGDLWVDEWWEFKNRAAYERAVSEFKEARQKGVETIPAELRERYERTMTERDSAFERQIEASRGREGDGAVSVSTSDRAMMRAKAEELSERLGIEIEILEDGSEFTGKKSKAKGFFNPKTGKVTIILGNNRDLADVEQTVLHEAVAHYGLRQLFGEHFDTFLDNIYEHSEPSIRRAIDELAKRRGYSLRTATEEYLAQLAEDSSIYESERHSWLHKVRAFFRDMLEALGFKYAGDSISFNEIRYILWRSYENLTERGGGLFGRAKDVAIQHRLGIGEYAYRGEENAIEQINGRFNAELERQIAGKLPQGHIYELGMPGEALLRAGLPNLPIEMSSTRLAEKSRQDNHPFAMSEVRDLPRAIQEPMAVFRSATRIGSYVVLTEIEHNGKNYVVAIETNRRKGKIEINDIRSVHYRTSNIHFVNWIEDGLLEYADKEKMSEWISKQRYHSAEVRNRFRHVAKIVEKFENPAIEEDVFYREGEENERRSIFDRARGIASRLFGRGQQATEAEQTATEEPSYFDPDEYIERNGNDSRTPEEELAELGYEVDAEAMQREISSGNDLGSVYPEQETPASIAKHLVTLIKYRRGDISLQEAESELFGGSIGQSEAELRELMEWHYAQKAAVLRGVTPTGTDNQGNPIDKNGRLIVEEVWSIDEITDEDFTHSNRSVKLPAIPLRIENAIGTQGKPIIIKKNVFEKNAHRHKDLTPEDSRRILKEALFNPDLYGQNQKTSRPYNWILIHIAETNLAVIIEINDNKDNVEIVNWHYISDDAIERKKRQAIREGGLILTLESAVADTSNSLLEDKGRENKSEKQKKSRKEIGKEVVRPDELTGIRERYDRRIRSGMYQSIEAMQDNIHNYAEYA